MPHGAHTEVTGTVSHIFAHRFVLEGADGSILCDLTPYGEGALRDDTRPLQVGDKVSVEGEQKPSELKVTRLTRGAETIDIAHGEPKHTPVDPAVIQRAVAKAGYETRGEPRRKPKHFEVLGQRDGRWEELHVELDGHIRKVKPAKVDDPKWGQAGAA